MREPISAALQVDVLLCRLEERKADPPGGNLEAFDPKLLAAIRSLEQAGFWKPLLEAGGSMPVHSLQAKVPLLLD